MIENVNNYSNRARTDHSNRHSQHFGSLQNNNPNPTFNIPHCNSQTKVDSNNMTSYQNQNYTRIGIPRDSFVFSNNQAQYLEVNQGSQIYRDEQGNYQIKNPAAQYQGINNQRSQSPFYQSRLSTEHQSQTQSQLQNYNNQIQQPNIRSISPVIVQQQKTLIKLPTNNLVHIDDQDTIQQLKMKVASQQEQIDDLSTINQLKDEQIQLNSQQDEEFRQIIEQNRELDQQVDKYKKKYQTSKELNRKLKTDLRDSQIQIDQLQDQLKVREIDSQLVEHNRQLKDQIKQMQKRYQELENRNFQMRKKIIDLESY